jgi:hypothetical protein
MQKMSQTDGSSAMTLATALIHMQSWELLKTAQTSPELVAGWLSELLVAWRRCRGQSDMLAEAIEDMRAALLNARPVRDNVISIGSRSSR